MVGEGASRHHAFGILSNVFGQQEESIRDAAQKMCKISQFLLALHQKWCNFGR
jgi:hypothetical protein